MCLCRSKYKEENILILLTNIKNIQNLIYIPAESVKNDANKSIKQVNMKNAR